MINRLINRLIKYIKFFFKRRKISKQLDEINQELEFHLWTREIRRDEINRNIISYARKRIKPKKSAHIPDKRLSRFALHKECKSKFSKDFSEEFILKNNLELKNKKIN
jgi:hypothetical protein